MTYRYSKPIGYNTMGLTSQRNVYKPFNGFASGSGAYAPGNYSAQTNTLAFTGTPANGSQITVPDGPVNQPSTPNLKTFTFTWAGSPGAGIIPLVAGGGTAAQAATAASVALAAQLTNWSVALTAATVVRLTSLQPSVNVSSGLVGATNITLTTVLSAIRAVLPCIRGRGFGWLANDTVSVPVAPS